jgi:hypothetical protein
VLRLYRGQVCPDVQKGRVMAEAEIQRCGRKGQRQQATAETRRKPCQRGKMSRKGVTGRSHREDSARALPTRRSMRWKWVIGKTRRKPCQHGKRRLSQSLASAEWCHETVTKRYMMGHREGSTQVLPARITIQAGASWSTGPSKKS